MCYDRVMPKHPPKQTISVAIDTNVLAGVDKWAHANHRSRSAAVNLMCDRFLESTYDRFIEESATDPLTGAQPLSEFLQ